MEILKEAEMERIKIGSISPEICPLGKFYTEKVSGLRLPTIQREFVWDAEDIKELLDSIINGYPIGAIIIWKPDIEFPSVPLIGEEEKVRQPAYILDGQQRITALMLAINGWKIKRGDKEILSSPIHFVPESEKFYIGSRKGIDVSLIIKAAMADPDALIKLQKEYPSTYKKAIDLVGRKVISYPLPLYNLESYITEETKEKVYEGIAEIFTRVNSAGVKIGNLAMFLSFFAAVFPREAKDKIIEIHKNFSKVFELDLEPIIRFVFSKMGMKQNQITKVPSFKRAIEDLKEAYKGKDKEVNKVINRVGKSIGVILGLLDEEFGISSTQFLPSQNALLPLFEYCYNSGFEKSGDISKTLKNKMLNWFLVASFNGIYSSSPNKKIEEDLGIVKKNRKFPTDELFKVMKDRIRTDTIESKYILNYYQDVLRGRVGKEYLMLLDILLYRSGATDWTGKVVKSEEAAIHHIFPRECLKENGFTDSQKINSIANLTLISQDINAEIGDELPEEYIPQYAREVSVLDQHFIPPNKQLWEIDCFEDFLDARLKLIWKATKNLLEELT